MAREDLPDGGMLCEYNGWTASPAAYTSAFSVKPQLDPSGRTVTHATYTITVTDYIVPETLVGDPTTDPLVEDAVARLSRNAGVFRFRGRGFGDLDINTNRNPRDVKWGPLVRDISCKTIGAGRVVELTATFEFNIVNCDDGLSAGVLAFTFTIGYDIDSFGYTTRNYQSILTIAQTRKSVGDRTLTDTADSFREKTVPPVPPNFKPGTRTFNLSADKCTLTTSVQHIQMPPTAPPQFVVEASAEHSYQSTSLGSWSGTISATYDVDRGADARWAVLAFRALVRERVRRAKEMVIGEGLDFGVLAKLGPSLVAGNNVSIIPYSGSAAEANIYGRLQVRLSLSYTAVGIGFSEILARGGLWTPIPVEAGGRWKEWAASVPLTFSPRGHAVMEFRPNDDAIVDLCGKSEPKTPPVKQTSSQNERVAALELLKAGLAVQRGVDASAVLGIFPTPQAANSWLAYQCSATVHANTGRVLGTTLPDTPLSTDGQQANSQWDVMRTFPVSAPAGGSAFPPLRGALESEGGGAFVQQRVKPTLFVTISGVALRAGYEIPVPELTKVNGKTPVLVGTPMFKQCVVAQASVPIVRAEWSLTYAFVDDGSSGGAPTAAIPVPPNGLLT